jgi:hypothetical protein
MAKVVEHLSSKCKDLNLDLNTPQNKRIGGKGGGSVAQWWYLPSMCEP